MGFSEQSVVCYHSRPTVVLRKSWKTWFNIRSRPYELGKQAIDYKAMSVSVHSDAVSQLNNHFILQFNMTLLTLRPLSEPHHSTLHLFICLTALQSLFFSVFIVSIYLYTSESERKGGQTLCCVLHCEVN